MRMCVYAYVCIRINRSTGGSSEVICNNCTAAGARAGMINRATSLEHTLRQTDRQTDTQAPAPTYLHPHTYIPGRRSGRPPRPWSAPTGTRGPSPCVWKCGCGCVGVYVCVGVGVGVCMWVFVCFCMGMGCVYMHCVLSRVARRLRSMNVEGQRRRGTIQNNPPPRIEYNTH
jgi:hypothetical protein